MARRGNNGVLSPKLRIPCLYKPDELGARQFKKKKDHVLMSLGGLGDSQDIYHHTPYAGQYLDTKSS